MGDDMKQIISNILSKIDVAYSKALPEHRTAKPLLVAVSKTKPKEAVIEAYFCGQRHFGENYVQELVTKSKDEEVLEKCKDIQWHFIGHLQRKNIPKLMGVKNLYLVETVDSVKVADALNQAWTKLGREQPLNVMVQVNTSLEQSKSGIKSDQVNDMVGHILSSCPNLKFVGLMTIGSFDHDLSKGINPDFQELVKCRDKLVIEKELAPENVGLSMGMSNDFEHAVEMGSTNVRVGSTIFGVRVYPSS